MPTTDDAIAQQIQRLESLNTEPRLRRERAPYCGLRATAEAVPVYVNVYHLIDVAVNRQLMAGAMGVFHSGVQIFGTEYSFGSPADPAETSGVFTAEPMNAVGSLHSHNFVGCTALSAERFHTLLARAKCEWPTVAYHVLGNNCNAFCEWFCALLATTEELVFPSWVNRLSNLGDTVLPRRFSTWAVIKATGVQPPNAATVNYDNQVGSDVRAEARNELRTNPAHRQAQSTVARRVEPAPRKLGLAPVERNSAKPGPQAAAAVAAMPDFNTGREPPTGSNATPRRHADPFAGQPGNVASPSAPEAGSDATARTLARAVTFDESIKQQSGSQSLVSHSPLMAPPASPEHQRVWDGARSERAETPDVVAAGDGFAPSDDHTHDAGVTESERLDTAAAGLATAAAPASDPNMSVTLGLHSQLPTTTGFETAGAEVENTTLTANFSDPSDEGEAVTDGL